MEAKIKMNLGDRISGGLDKVDMFFESKYISSHKNTSTEISREEYREMRDGIMAVGLFVGALITLFSPLQGREFGGYLLSASSGIKFYQAYKHFEKRTNLVNNRKK